MKNTFKIKTNIVKQGRQVNEEFFYHESQEPTSSAKDQLCP